MKSISELFIPKRNIAFSGGNLNASIFFILISVGAALSYALMKISFYEFYKKLEIIPVLVMVVFFFFHAGRIKLSTPLFLFLVSIFCALLSWLMMRLHYPEWASASPSVERLARNFTFVFIGFSILSLKNGAAYFLALAGLGLLLLPWSAGGGVGEIMSGTDRRISYGLQNAQHMGVLFGIFLIGLLVFSPRIMRIRKGSWVFGGIWLVALVFCFFSVYASQTRAVFLGLLIAFIVSIPGFFYIRSVEREVSGPAKFNFYMAGAVLAILLIAIFFIYSKVLFRSETDMRFLWSFLKGDEAAVISSAGVRINSWLASIEWVLQRPWFGWGNRGGELVMNHTDWLREYTKGLEFGHLHNSYLEVLVRYGVAGALPYVFLAIWSVREARRAIQDRRLPGDFALFFFLFAIFWIVVNFFESYMFFRTGVYAFNVMGAAFLYFIWRPVDVNSIEYVGGQS